MNIRTTFTTLCVSAGIVVVAACSGVVPDSERTAAERLALAATTDPSAMPAPAPADASLVDAQAPKEASLVDAPPPYCTQNCVCCTATDSDGGVRPPYFWTTPDWCRANGYTINNYSQDSCFD
jgi:hypothetical protein